MGELSPSLSREMHGPYQLNDVAKFLQTLNGACYINQDITHESTLLSHPLRNFLFWPLVDMFL